MGCGFYAVVTAEAGSRVGLNRSEKLSWRVGRHHSARRYLESITLVAAGTQPQVSRVNHLVVGMGLHSKTVDRELPRQGLSTVYSMDQEFEIN